MFLCSFSQLLNYKRTLCVSIVCLDSAMIISQCVTWLLFFCTINLSVLCLITPVQPFPPSLSFWTGSQDVAQVVSVFPHRPSASWSDSCTSWCQTNVSFWSSNLATKILYTISAHWLLSTLPPFFSPHKYFRFSCTSLLEKNKMVIILCLWVPVKGSGTQSCH